MRRRVQANAARYRALGADYLAYALIDTVVDGYFHIQDAFENALERLDEELLDDPGQSTLASIHEVKRAIITTRRAISPLRELLLSLQHSDSGLIRPATKLYFRDVYDHSLRVMELVESSREIIADMTGVYLSFLSNRMNEIMKVLTLFMAIFIPLTFIAGIYGMNFEYMPELEFRWAYPAVWGVCILLTLLMLLFFRRKKWL
jgi:magnesium transporter